MLIRDGGGQTNHIGEDRWVERMDQTKKGKVRENPRCPIIYMCTSNKIKYNKKQ